MDKLIYQGKKYIRPRDKWADTSGIAVSESLQSELNHIFAQKIDPYSLATQDCIDRGDEFKKSGSMGLALKFYEAEVESADKKTMARILPRVTSCYRANGQPQKAIDILAQANLVYGKDMVTPVLLTSVAAAYCDLEDYARAKKCCDRALAMAEGEMTPELGGVYRRIKAAEK